MLSKVKLKKSGLVLIGRQDEHCFNFCTLVCKEGMKLFRGNDVGLLGSEALKW